jgi:glycosyltransferase involved in cell wall biosynthesis
MVTLAVIIPLYNKAEAIARTLHSVLEQSRLPDELVIVDDGSSDGSLEAAKAAVLEAKTSVYCQFVAQENAGVSVARNRGANASKADYICFLDADDEWLPDYLAEVEKLAIAYPDAGVLSIRSAKINVDSTLVPEPSALPDPYFGVVENMLETYRQGYGVMHTSAITVKRERWEQYDGFPPGARKSQDMQLWLRLSLNEKFAHSSQPLSIWHDDFSGIARRKGVVPYHFTYFLAMDEGKKHLINPSLLAFLGSNMLIHIGGHRITQDAEVVKALRELASALPLSYRLKALIISYLPMPLLNGLVWLRRRARGLKR